MNQTALDLDLDRADPVDHTGFELGWDHARHALVPPPGLLLEGTPVAQGWRAGKAVFGRRTLMATHAVRQWLELRTLAWRRGIAFETQHLTAHVLTQLRVVRCPVLRVPLGGAPGEPSAAAFERVNPEAGYAAGNVLQMSRAAADARAVVTIVEALRRARRAEASGETIDGLDAGAWWRVAALRSYTTPLPFAQAAALPLALLPPNRVRLLNAVQGLQALLTQQFMAPGWSERLRTVAARLPEHTLRQDFTLWIGSMVPRVLDAERAPPDLRIALEDAWLHERVQRRWQHFALTLGEAGVEALLAQVAEVPLPGRVALQHATEQATEGWGLAQAVPLRLSGRPAPVAPRALSVRRSSAAPVRSAGAPGR